MTPTQLNFSIVYFRSKIPREEANLDFGREETVAALCVVFANASFGNGLGRALTGRIPNSVNVARADRKCNPAVFHPGDRSRISHLAIPQSDTRRLLQTFRVPTISNFAGQWGIVNA